MIRLISIDYYYMAELVHGGKKHNNIIVIDSLQSGPKFANELRTAHIK